MTHAASTPLGDFVEPLVRLRYIATVAPFIVIGRKTCSWGPKQQNGLDYIARSAKVLVEIHVEQR